MLVNSCLHQSLSHRCPFQTRCVSRCYQFFFHQWPSCVLACGFTKTNAELRVWGFMHRKLLPSVAPAERRLPRLRITIRRRITKCQHRGWSKIEIWLNSKVQKILMTIQVVDHHDDWRWIGIRHWYRIKNWLRRGVDRGDPLIACFDEMAYGLYRVKTTGSLEVLSAVIAYSYGYHTSNHLTRVTGVTDDRRLTYDLDVTKVWNDSRELLDYRSVPACT
jgi:hypothetical protein